VLLSSLLAACGGGGDTPLSPEPAAVEIGLDSTAVLQGGNASLSASVRDAKGAAVTRAVTWSSADSTVVAVDGSGGLTAGRPGAAWVTASLGILKDSVRVRVRPVWTRVSVAHGGGATCALALHGEAYCWGTDLAGQLGRLGTSRVPAAVQTQHRFKEIALARTTTCALELDGSPYCWGEGFDGQLGTGAHAATSLVTASSGNLHLSSLTALAAAFCGLTAVGDLYCWGSDEGGALGVDPPVGVPLPGPYHAPLRWTRLSGGWEHLCGISLGDQTLYCWGNAQDGEIGDGSGGGGGATAWEAPTVVTGIFLPGSPAAGRRWSCAINSSGVPYCWGGAFGVNRPALLATGARFSNITPGDAQMCGRTGTGETWCWTDLTSPARVEASDLFSQIALGGSDACGLTAAGALYCWGGNQLGALGTGDTAPRVTPTRVVDPE
jgi:alpha-tubulin suppressor-like RCC1 family protein